MVITVRRQLNKGRRQCWSFTLAPVDREENSITLVLAEYALEEMGKTGWVRQSNMFYKRRQATEARLPLKNVPPMDEVTRELLRNQLWRQTAVVAQFESGTVNL